MKNNLLQKQDPTIDEEWFDDQCREIAAAKSRIEKYKQTVEWVRDDSKKARDNYKAADEAFEFFRKLSQELQNELHEKIAGVATTCLRSVFEDDYEVKIDFESKRNSTEATIILRHGELETGTRDAVGFGVLDVLGFAFRMGAICATRGTPKLLVLDESFRFVSASYRGTLATLLEELSEEIGLQVVQVTHIEELKIGRIIGIE